MKGLKISYLIAAALAAPGAWAADQQAVPLFTIEIAKPWAELDRAVVVNDAARFDKDALSARDGALPPRRKAGNPG